MAQSLVEGKEEPYLTFEVTRDELLDEAIEELSELHTSEADCLRPLRVNFVEVGGKRETAIDNGGPSREFACRFAAQLANSNFMEGKC